MRIIHGPWLHVSVQCQLYIDFALVVRLSSAFVLSLVVNSSWSMHQVDILNKFLYIDLDE